MNNTGSSTTSAAAANHTDDSLSALTAPCYTKRTSALRIPHIDAAAAEAMPLHHDTCAAKYRMNLRHVPPAVKKHTDTDGHCHTSSNNNSRVNCRHDEPHQRDAPVAWGKGCVADESSNREKGSHTSTVYTGVTVEGNNNKEASPVVLSFDTHYSMFQPMERVPAQHPWMPEFREYAPCNNSSSGNKDNGNHMPCDEWSSPFSSTLHGNTVHGKDRERSHTIAFSSSPSSPVVKHIIPSQYSDIKEGELCSFLSSNDNPLQLKESPLLVDVVSMSSATTIMPGSGGPPSSAVAAVASSPPHTPLTNLIPVMSSYATASAASLTPSRAYTATPRFPPVSPPLTPQKSGRRPSATARRVASLSFTSWAHNASMEVALNCSALSAPLFSDYLPPNRNPYSPFRYASMMDRQRAEEGESLHISAAVIAYEHTIPQQQHPSLQGTTLLLNSTSGTVGGMTPEVTDKDPALPPTVPAVAHWTHDTASPQPSSLQGVHNKEATMDSDGSSGHSQQHTQSHGISATPCTNLRESSKEGVTPKPTLCATPILVTKQLFTFPESSSSDDVNLSRRTEDASPPNIHASPYTDCREEDRPLVFVDDNDTITSPGSAMTPLALQGTMRGHFSFSVPHAASTHHPVPPFALLPKGMRSSTSTAWQSIRTDAHCSSSVTQTFGDSPLCERIHYVQQQQQGVPAPAHTVLQQNTSKISTPRVAAAAPHLVISAAQSMLDDSLVMQNPSLIGSIQENEDDSVSTELDHEECFDSDDDDAEPWDRFRQHHSFQFAHYVPCVSEQGFFVPLSVDTNGIIWLATHRLDGMPYAVKEVPDTNASTLKTELECLTLGSDPVTYAELCAEAFLVRYYSCTRYPVAASAAFSGGKLNQRDGDGLTHATAYIVQMEYLPCGSVWDCLFYPAKTTAASTTPRMNYWTILQHALMGLDALHAHGIIHGKPLLHNLFMVDRHHYKLGNFGSAVKNPKCFPCTNASVCGLLGSLTPFEADVRVLCRGIFLAWYVKSTANAARVRPTDGWNISVAQLDGFINTVATPDACGCSPRFFHILSGAVKEPISARDLLMRLGAPTLDSFRACQLYQDEIRRLRRLCRKLEDEKARKHTMSKSSHGLPLSPYQRPVRTPGGTPSLRPRRGVSSIPSLTIPSAIGSSEVTREPSMGAWTAASQETEIKPHVVSWAESLVKNAISNASLASAGVAGALLEGTAARGWVGLGEGAGPSLVARLSDARPLTSWELRH